MRRAHTAPWERGRNDLFMKKRVAVVGYGGMGQWHVCSIMGRTYMNSIPFNESDVCEMAGIYDIDPAKRDKARADGLHVYETLEELLADPTVDIVTIATPNDFHEPIAIKALDAGKNVISEKPVTMSLASLDRMIAASENNHKLFSVHQNRRLDDYFVEMKKIADEGLIGDIISLESRIHGDHGIPGDWRKTVEHGGGMLYDWGVHMIDQQLYMLGYDVERVYAHFDYLTGVPVDDGCFIDIFLKSGKFLHVEICTYNFIHMPLMYMRGRTGTAIYNDWGDDVHVTRCTDWGDHDDILPVKVAAGLTKTLAPRGGRAIEKDEFKCPHTDPHDYYRNFCAAIDGKEQQLVTHEQMRTVMRVIEAAFESAKNHSVVEL